MRDLWSDLKLHETGAWSSHPKQCVLYLSLPISAVNAIADCSAAIVAVNLSSRDYWDMFVPSPGHHSANMGQDLSVVPYACVAPSK